MFSEKVFLKNNSIFIQVFNCPANLASHKRWHKPRAMKKPITDNSPIKIVKNKAVEESEELANGESTEGGFPCLDCGKTFRRCESSKMEILKLNL
jgi:hypothetical protein